MGNALLLGNWDNVFFTCQQHVGYADEGEGHCSRPRWGGRVVPFPPPAPPVSEVILLYLFSRYLPLFLGNFFIFLTLISVSLFLLCLATVSLIDIAFIFFPSLFYVSPKLLLFLFVLFVLGLFGQFSL